MQHSFNIPNRNSHINLITGQNWSDAKQSVQNDLIASIFDQVDDGDDIIQKEEVLLLRKLFDIADSENNDNDISDKECKELLEKIKNNTIDIQKMKQDVLDEENNKFSNFEDITSNIMFKPASNYNITILQDVDPENSFYKTFAIKFKDPKTNFEQDITIKFEDSYYSDKKIHNIIKEILEKCNNNVIDLLCNETEELRFLSPKNSSRYISDNVNYSRMGGHAKAAAKYTPDDEKIRVYTKFDINILVHELGHAKDFGSNNACGWELFDAIEEQTKYNGESKTYAFVNGAELYAELFKDYFNIQNHVESNLTKQYSDIINIFSDKDKKKFIQAYSTMLMTGENKTIGDILQETGMEKYKNNLGEKINTKINIDIPGGAKNYEMNSRLSKLQKLARNNPKINELYKNLISEIANGYNNPRNGKIRMGI